MGWLSKVTGRVAGARLQWTELALLRTSQASSPSHLPPLDPNWFIQQSARSCFYGSFCPLYVFTLSELFSLGEEENKLFGKLFRCDSGLLFVVIGAGPATQLLVAVTPWSSSLGPEAPQAGERARNLLWWGGHGGAVARALLLWGSQVGGVQRGSFQWEELL